MRRSARPEASTAAAVEDAQVLVEWRRLSLKGGPDKETATLIAAAQRVSEVRWRPVGGRPNRILRKIRERHHELQAALDAVPANGLPCRLHGLNSQAGRRLNGMQGTVMDFEEESGRVLVRLLPGDPPDQWKKIRPENMSSTEGKPSDEEAVGSASEDDQCSGGTGLTGEEVEEREEDLGGEAGRGMVEEAESTRADEVEPREGDGREEDEQGAAAEVFPAEDNVVPQLTSIPAERSDAVTEVTFVLLDVSSSMGQSDRSFVGVSRDVGYDSSSVLVQNVPEEATEEDLRSVFGAEVVSVYIPKHAETYMSKGHAYLKFVAEESADQARRMKAHCHGQRLFVQQCFSRGTGCFFCGGAGHVVARCSLRISRLDAAKQLFQKFAERNMDYGIRQALGLLVFGTELEAICSMTQFLEVFRRRTLRNVEHLQPGGQTRLFDAMLKAAGFVDEFAQNGPTNCRKRLLVLTDGDDVGSKTTAQVVTSRLLDSAIVVDCVVLGKEESGPLRSIAAQTGGLKFRPGSLREALDLFEREALLSLTSRAAVAAQLRKAAFDNVDRVPLAQTMCGARATHGVVALPALRTRPAERYRRIGKELHEVLYHAGLRFALLCRESGLPLPWVEVYPEEDSERWHILLGGTQGTPYAESFFELVAEFPESYPFEPPKMRFVTPPLHVNISKEGRICDLVLSRRNYSVSTSMLEVIFRIHQLLHSPNQSEALNTEVAQLRMDLQQEPGRFEAVIRAHSLRTAFRNPEQFYAARGLPALSPQEKRLLCPISHQLLFDPVVTPDGHICERQALLWAIELGTTPSALGGENVQADDLRDYPAARDAVAAWSGPKAQRLWRPARGQAEGYTRC